MKKELPLVSVPVITFNSAKTVIETLESIKDQTYPNIELIISDDCSTDNTVEICRNWIEQNKSRFVRTELLTVEENTGVAGNNNRAAKACQGEWVKSIAGDDLLLPNCVQDCLTYMIEHPEANIVFGFMKVFGGNENECLEKEGQINAYVSQMKDCSSEEQLQRVIRGYCPPAPTCFSRNDSQLFYNDGRIPLIEDWPKWIRFLQKGYRFDFIEKELVSYRLGGISTSHRWESLELFYNKRMVHFLYVWNYLYERNPDDAIQWTIREECEIYKELEKCMSELERIRMSKSYRIGRLITRPFSKIKKIVNSLLDKM